MKYLEADEYALFEYSQRRPLVATRVSKKIGGLLSLARLRFGANEWCIVRGDGVTIAQSKDWQL